MKLRDFANLMLLGSIWGASYLFIKVAVGVFPPATVVATRVLLAGLVSLGLLTLRGSRLPLTRTAWRSFAVMGMLNGAIPYVLIAWGEQYITSGLAAILIAAVPLFTALFAQVFLPDERLTVMKALGLLLGFVGVAVLIGPDALTGASNNLLGDLAVLGAAVSYGAAFIWTRRQERRVDPLAATTGQLLMATVYMLPVALLLDQPWTLPIFTPQNWGAGGATVGAAIASLLILAVVGTSFAYLLYYGLVASVGATLASLVTYISPFTGIVWGAILLGERLTIWAFVGFGLILMGMALITGFAAQMARRWAFGSAGR